MYRLSLLWHEVLAGIGIPMYRHGGPGSRPHPHGRSRYRLEQLRENRVPVGMSSTSIVRNMLVLGALSYG